MPQEVIDNIPMPAWVLESYGTPMNLIRELIRGNQK